MNKAFVLSFVIVMVLSATVIMAAEPVNRQISLQGKLGDAAGKPIDGNYVMTFKIFDVETGGTALWTEPQTVMVSKGLFTVKLGSVTAFPADVKFDKPYYVEISVKKGTATETLIPRYALAASPFSMYTAPAVSGTFDAAAIVSGVLNAARIPVLDIAAKTSGSLPAARLTGDVSGLITGTISGSKITGDKTINAGVIDASLVDYSKWWRLNTAAIPFLDASKITSGEFSIDRIPTIPTTKLHSNVHGCSFCLSCGGNYPSYGGSVSHNDENNPPYLRGWSCEGDVVQKSSPAKLALCCGLP